MLSRIVSLSLFFLAGSHKPAAAVGPGPEQYAAPAWEAHWEEIPASALPALTPDGDLTQFKLALDRQLENCREYKEGKFKHCKNEAAAVELFCEPGLLELLDKHARASKTWTAFYKKAKTAFRWLRYKAAPETFVYTGYNSPLFQGTITPDTNHRHPIFARPADLVDERGSDGLVHWGRKLEDGTIVPYDDRKKIDIERSLDGKNLEQAWFEFPGDIMRLQIEGSGVLETRGANGRVKLFGVNFAGKNGHPYVSVFKYLKDKGVDKKYLSFAGLKQYFLDFPADMWPTLTSNPSYVFFSVGEEPPCGTARVHLTGGHSIATDTTQLPLGLVGFLEGERPVEGSDPAQGPVATKPFTRFAVAQDTGGAIKNAHVDIYWGTGAYAQLASDVMKSKGRLYLPRLKKRK